MRKNYRVYYKIVRGGEEGYLNVSVFIGYCINYNEWWFLVILLELMLVSDPVEFEGDGKAVNITALLLLYDDDW